jgi:hypothetical protein
MWDLEEERRRRLAAISGDPRGVAAVPAPRVVGGFGETPGFVYREHLHAVLAHGTPPIPALRRILLGDERPAVSAAPATSAAPSARGPGSPG